MVNGNISPNNTVYSNPNELKNAIEIKLNGIKKITDFENTYVNLKMV